MIGLEWARDLCDCTLNTGELHRHFRLVDDGKTIDAGYVTKELDEDAGAKAAFIEDALVRRPA